MKKLFFILLFLHFTYGLSTTQINVLKNVYQTCKKYHASDGFSFEQTCAAIALTESSAGKEIVGDQFNYPDILVSSSLGVMQIRVRTVLEVLKNYPRLRSRYYYMWHSNIDAIKKYVPILYSIKNIRYALSKALIDHQWSKVTYYRKRLRKLERRFNRYKKAYKKDLLIAETLLSDLKFSAIIAAHYLILNYETAKRRHMWNPWWKAVSRYNGGWYNKSYVHKVSRNLRIVKKLLKEKKL